MDILELADPYIRILGAITSNFPTGQYKISECIFDMEAMANLNDTILDIIMNDPREELKPAKDLLDNLYSRKMV